MRLIDIGGIDMLKSQGRNVNDYNFKDGGSALHYILLFDVVCLEVFNRMVEVGGLELVLMTDRKSWTALHYVVESGRTRWPRLDLVDKLLEIGGAELVMMTDQYGHTALHHALGLGCFQFDGMSPSIDVVNRLLAVGGQQLVMISDSGLGQTVLHRICLNKRTQPNLDVVDRLLTVGGEPLIFMRDAHGNTLLHLACFRSVLRDNDLRLIERLIERGRKELVLMTDDVGRTAMQIQLEMSFNSSQEIIDRFVEVGGEDLFLVRTRCSLGRNRQ
jgi:ankyrin repeat protein